MLSQERTIEKRGILILTPEERKALDLQIHVIVKQTPNKGVSWNYKIYPNRSFFGWATLMIQVSTYKDIELQFLNQCIYHNSRAIEQGAGTDMNNFDTMLSAIVTLSKQITPPLGIVSKLPTVPVVYGLCPITVVNFEIPEGVVIKVQTHILAFSDSASIFTDEQSNSSPPPDDDGVKTPPVVAPPPGSPPNTRNSEDLLSDAPFVISPPYDGDDDSGRTYIPPASSPPWSGEDGQDETKYYDVRIRLTPRNPDGTRQGADRVDTYARVPGKIYGLGSKNPNNADAPFGILSTTLNPSVRQIGLNYEFKNGWPYPQYTSYFDAKIESLSLSSPQ